MFGFTTQKVAQTPVPKFNLGDRVMYREKIYGVVRCNWSEYCASFVYALGTTKCEIGGVAEDNLILVTRPTKSTLKSMDIVKLKSGKICMVAPNENAEETGLSLYHLGSCGNKGCVIHLDKYDEDLTSLSHTDYDIVAVYQPRDSERFMCANNYLKNCPPTDKEWTWRKNTIVEITIEEAAKFVVEHFKAKGKDVDEVKILI